MILWVGGPGVSLGFQREHDRDDAGERAIDLAEVYVPRFHRAGGGAAEEITGRRGGLGGRVLEARRGRRLCYVNPGQP